MTHLKHIDNSELMLLEDDDRRFDRNDLVIISDAAQNIVSQVTDTISDLSRTYKDIALISAQVEIETKRIDQALDCLMVKAKHDLQIYKDTLPLLEKNFASMHSRMDKLMDRALDMLCEDVSDASLSRQESVMKLIEITNNALNNLVEKLLPRH